MQRFWIAFFIVSVPVVTSQRPHTNFDNTRWNPGSGSFNRPRAFGRNDISTSEILAEPFREITTAKGRVKGTVVKLDKVYEYNPYTLEIVPDEFAVQFLGIPYANPPIREWRFRPPEPRRRYTQYDWQSDKGTELPGLVFQPACPQRVVDWQKLMIEKNGGVGEDCLYLNIYMPFFERNVFPSTARYPVLVFFHGGDFQHGAAQLYPGHHMAKKGVIVVTLNYRLGALGFMTLGKENAAGNYGFLDTHMALTWIQENIHYFHGDPSKVTIWGEGAGAAMVGLHMISAKNEGKELFHKAIASSGAEVADWATYVVFEQAVNHTRELARQLGCHWTTETDVMNCFRSREADDFTNTNVRPEYGSRPPFAPVIDGLFRERSRAVFTGPPRKLLEYGNIARRVPYMLGVTRDEAARDFYTLKFHPDFNPVVNKPYYVPVFVLEEGLDELTPDQFRDKVYNFTVWQNYTKDFETRKAIVDSLRFEYTYWSDPNNRTLQRQALIDLLSDHRYRGPCASSAKLHTTPHNVPPVYVYTFDFRSRNTTRPRWTGVQHGADSPYVWGVPWLTESYPYNVETFGVNWTEADRNMSDAMQRMWINFANFTRPIYRIGDMPYLWENASWPPYNLKEQMYLKINSTPELLREFAAHKAAFWNEFLPSLADLHLPYRFWPQTSYYERYHKATWSLVGVVLLLLLVILILLAVYCIQRGRIQDHKRIEDMERFDRSLDRSLDHQTFAKETLA